MLRYIAFAVTLLLLAKNANGEADASKVKANPVCSSKSINKYRYVNNVALTARSF